MDKSRSPLGKGLVPRRQTLRLDRDDSVGHKKSLGNILLVYSSGSDGRATSVDEISGSKESRPTTNIEGNVDSDCDESSEFKWGCRGPMIQLESRVFCKVLLQGIWLFTDLDYTLKTIRSQSKANLRIRCVDSARTTAVIAATTAPEVQVDGDGNNIDAISSLPTSLCSGDDTNGIEDDRRFHDYLSILIV
ncbi:hypothetical protein LWI28_026698 [Acer negundo]|uniref:Uncharacterized protein n=1 Tax=Acer negundo TaxID=4023 RepID=A0AAD5I7N0_ACENE|nr:hypothetical protein LWI28_026698 [Acer negundo]